MLIDIAATKRRSDLLRAVPLATLLLWVGGRSLPVAAADVVRSEQDAGGRRYELIDSYYASASAGILREKTVTSRYELLVTHRGGGENGHRVLDVVVDGVVVQVDVPAQQRKASFDSSHDKADADVTSHELARPLSLLGRRLTFQISDDGTIKSIGGLDAVEKKLATVFEDAFGGTEVFEYARKRELELIGEERMCETWGALLASTVRSPGLQSAKRPAEFHVDACVPSESWTRPLRIRCSLKSQSRTASGETEVSTKGVFKTVQPAESSIGPCPWNYQIAGGTFENVTKHTDAHQFLSATRSITADIDSTIVINGKDIALNMSVRHTWALKDKN